MQFELFRMVLLKKEGDLLSVISPKFELGREETIRDIFSRKFIFVHRKQEFTYLLDSSLSDGSVVVGRIGRSRLVEENEPPEQGLVETTREPWLASLLVVDPTAHDDGQKIAFEEREIGAPLSIISSFFTYINSLNEYGFEISVSPIVDTSTFWDFEKENRGDITSITFELLAPNMFGSRSALDEEMEKLRDHEKAKEAILTLKNKEGLNLDSGRTRETVDYALRGGGNIRAKAKNKKKYNSKKNIKTIPVVSDGEVGKRSVIDMIRTTFLSVF